MKNLVALAGLLLAGTACPAQANCPPPMQLLFSCTLEDDGARVEFCHQILEKATSNASSVPGDLKTYSLARGIEPAELFFQPTANYFESFSANAVDRKIYGQDVSAFLVTGYENRDHVYAALLAVDEDLYSGFNGAEIRVFRNAEDMDDAKQGSEIARYFCAAGSIVVDQQEFRP